MTDKITITRSPPSPRPQFQTMQRRSRRKVEQQHSTVTIDAVLEKVLRLREEGALR